MNNKIRKDKDEFDSTLLLLFEKHVVYRNYCDNKIKNYEKEVYNNELPIKFLLSD